MLEHWALWLVLGGVLLLPFLLKPVEERLEAFLLAMGCMAVSVSGLWSWHLAYEALTEPLGITIAVVAAGAVFRRYSGHLGPLVRGLAKRFGRSLFVFGAVLTLSLASSVVTAIIAALALGETVSALRLGRRQETGVVVAGCFAIGLGAVLTPLGEPLATLAVAKLKGEPYNADFFFLVKLVGIWVLPLATVCSGMAAWFARGQAEDQRGLEKPDAETWRDVFLRGAKVYGFVVGLVLLGAGFLPLVERYVLPLHPATLFWVNAVSAVLDNATLAAAEINSAMPEATLRSLLMGLLLAGGMLIPGNIPNIICAGKLGIKSADWAKVGLPMGLTLMALCFFAFQCVGQ